MNKIFIDFETRSKTDIKETGSWVYAADPSTDVLCVAYSINNDPVEVIPFIFGNETEYKKENLERLKTIFENKENIFVAHNARFEQDIYQNIFVKRFGFPELKPERWLCTMAQCLIHNVPGALQKAAMFLKLEVTKDVLGSKTMLILSRPDKKGEWNTKSEYYETLYNYCKIDVEVSRAIDKSLPPIPAIEKQVWNLDQEINNYGFKCDAELINKSLDCITKFEDDINQRLKEASEGYIESFTTLTSFKKYFAEKLNFPIESLNKIELNKLLSSAETPEKVKEILNLRLAVGKTSIKKYLTFNRASDENYIMRNTLQYHAASTGRWGGRLVQVQNLPRGKFKATEETIQEFKDVSYEKLFEKYGLDLLEFLSSNIRGCIIARENKTLIWSDYNAIETRVLAWLSGEENLLAAYKNNADIYCEMASKIYGKSITKENKTERQMGKQAILGCGYGMGGKKFAMTCNSYNMDISEDFGTRVVNIYRMTYKKIPLFWDTLQRDVVNAVYSKELIKRDKYSIICKNDFLYIKLPSGRYLSYYKPKFTGQELTYTGLNSQTKKEESIKLYGGKLTENLVQAIARDILVNAMHNLKNNGFNIIFSVHDEIIVEADKSVSEFEFDGCMLSQPLWAKDIPLAVETTIKGRYEK